MKCTQRAVSFYLELHVNKWGSRLGDIFWKMIWNGLDVLFCLFSLWNFIFMFVIDVFFDLCLDFFFQNDGGTEGTGWRTFFENDLKWFWLVVLFFLWFFIFIFVCDFFFDLCFDFFFFQDGSGAHRLGDPLIVEGGGKAKMGPGMLSRISLSYLVILITRYAPKFPR